MSSDLKLENSGVRVEGEYLFVNGASLEISHPDRRARGSGHQRRALVHETDDTLAVNWGDDYKGLVLNGSGAGGVKIKGEVTCSDLLAARRLNATHLLGVSEAGRLYVGGGAQFKQAPTAPDIRLSDLGGSEARPGVPSPASAPSLVEVIGALQSRIDELETKVRRLERR